MNENSPQPESFEDFKNSFSYGSRSDLNFKFLKSMQDNEAAGFIQDLFKKLGEAMDDGDYGRVVSHICKGQVDAYGKDPQFVYDTGPFSHLKKPVSESRLTLISSTGHFVKGEDPNPLGVENMSQETAVSRIQDFLKEEPVLSAIPFNTPMERRMVRHGGYDIHGVEADTNTGFPMDRCLELKTEGVIGDLTADAYSFVGACSQKRLLKKTGPGWVRKLKELEIDAALLVSV
jgi:hypothetical protein